MASVFLPMLIFKCCIMLLFCLCYFPEHDVSINMLQLLWWILNSAEERNDLFDLLSRKLFELSSFYEGAQLLMPASFSMTVRSGYSIVPSFICHY